MRKTLRNWLTSLIKEEKDETYWGSIYQVGRDLPPGFRVSLPGWQHKNNTGCNMPERRMTMKHTRESIIALIINECRKNGTDIVLRRADLSGLDLRGLDLRDADLRRADLRRANLRDADLRCADLRCADLRGADLQGSDLRGADLRRAYLRWANLQGSDLRGANLDFTGHELSCKTIGITADRRLVSQLLYHLCRMDVQDCPEWDELRNDGRIIDLANKSHVIDDYDLPEIEQTNAQEAK